jgi:hypothetical protein
MNSNITVGGQREVGENYRHRKVEAVSRERPFKIQRKRYGHSPKRQNRRPNNQPPVVDHGSINSHTTTVFPH